MFPHTAIFGAIFGADSRPRIYTCRNLDKKLTIVPKFGQPLLMNLSDWKKENSGKCLWCYPAALLFLFVTTTLLTNLMNSELPEQKDHQNFDSRLAEDLKIVDLLNFD